MTALLALFIAFPSLKAGNMQVYTAGDLPTSAGTFVAPDFFGGAGWSYRSRTMDPAQKDTAFFPNVLGVTDGVAYGIEISKTQDDPGNIFLSLNLHSCDSIIVAGWGTGGRGILVTNSANTDSSWKGASSYNLIQVPVKVGTDSPVEIKITPTGKDSKNSTSNGGTWITRIVVFAKEGSEVTQYYLSNPGFESPDTTLLVTTKNSGIWIPKGWTVDYPTFNEWDQGIVTSLNDAGGSALPLIAQEGSNFYYGRLRWATNLISLKQDMINPPAGYNVVSMEVASPDGYKAQLAVSTDADTVTESPTGTGWETIDLVFAGEEGKNATFSATASSASGAAQNRMFLDDARMVAYGTNFPPSVLDQRTALIAEANALYGDGSGEGAAALQEAINTFEAVPTTCALGPAETMMAALVALQTAGAELQAAMYDFNVANASPTNPMDLTSKVVNPSANQGRTGWNWSFSSAVQNQGIGTDALFTKATPPYFEAWTPAANKPMTGRIYQIITDLPNGKYELTVAAQGKGGATDNLHVYANDALSGIFVDTVITVPFMVTAGTAEIGIKAEAADVNWIAIDEIHLSYLGFDPAAMIDALNAQIAEADSLLTLKMKESVATELTNARTNAAAAVAASPAVKSQLEAAGAEMAAALPAANASIAGYATLKAAIEASEAKYNAEAPGAADFRAAIDAAQAAWDAAKIDPAVQITALAVANNAFDFAAASETNPVVTNLVVNPTFDTNTLGWSTTTGANNTGIASNQQGDFTVPFWENWSPNNFTGKMYQVIENVPNGDYLLKAAVFCNNGGSGLYLYANDDKVLANTTAPTYHEVMTRVTNNRLEIGIVMEEATNNWVGIDNVSLTYYNFYPSFTKTATGAIVKNLQELTEALAYTDYESADITIELMNCTDEGGVYLLGNSGFAFPQTGGDLTIKNAEGQNPVLAGRLTSNNGVKAATLLYEGLEFNAQSVSAAYDVDTYSPLYMAAADSIMVGLNVRNCLFTKLPLKQLILSTNKIANYAVIKDFVMEHCVIKDVGANQDTMAQHAGHMFQLANKKTYEFDHFTFRNNIVNNWRNSQVFNINRDGTTADSTDVNFVVTIENNLFYKFGGNATNVRNFLEYTKSLGGLTGVININNNIFYERGSQAGFPHAKLTMFFPAPGQSVTLNVLNNFFYPDNVVKDESTPENYPNLRLVGPAETDITFSRNDLFMDSFEGLSKVFRNEARLTISRQSPLFEAGTGGSFIGPEQIYVGNAGTPVIAFLTKQKTMAATAATVENDPVYLMMAADDNFIVDQIVLTDVSATSPVDLDAYDIALVQESFGGGDKILTPAGPLGLAKFDLPVLYNKTYAFKAGRALASGQPGSGAEQQGLSITVDPAQQGNDLFKGLTFADDNTLTLFKAPAMDDGTLGAEKSIKALNYAKEVVLSSENTPIAIPTGVTDAVIFINDLPAGTVVGGETLAERMITVGFNFGAMCADNGTNMTNAAFTIWRNALYMLAGMEVPSDPYDALPQTDGVQKNVVFTMGGNLYVQATEQTNINIYNVMGALVRTVRLEQGLNTIEGLSQGQIYVVKIDSEAIKVVL